MKRVGSITTGALILLTVLLIVATVLNVKLQQLIVGGF